jgi:NAD(P)-dependent dehydrogenase (short-subunit alcohol dehydrogenase family)
VPAPVSDGVFITGAASGIGAAAARVLARDGYTVFAGVHSTSGSLGSLPAARQVPVDVTDPASVAQAAKLVAAEVGDRGLDAVINNADIIVPGPLELLRPEDLQHQFAVNTLGPSTSSRPSCRCCAPGMAE